MQVLTALMTLGFSIGIAAPALASGNDVSLAAGAFGFLAGFVMLISSRVGFYALLGIAVLLGTGAVQGTVNGANVAVLLPLAVAYGLFAFMAYRTWQGQQHRRDERTRTAAHSNHLGWQATRPDDV